MAKKKDVQTDIDSANIARIAPLRLSNVGVNKIAEELKLTKHYVTRILDEPEFRAKLREISDEMTTQAVNSWKASVADLVPLAINVLKSSLTDGDLEAVKLVIRSLGIEKQETQVQQGNITVVLPDFNESSKQVKSEVIDI